MPLPTNPNRSELDFNQIFQRCYDEVNDRLRTDAIVNTDIGDVEVQLSHLDDSIRLGDGTGFYTSEIIGPKRALDVNVAGGTITTTITYPTEYKIINLSMPLADTEYSFVLPVGTRQVKIRVRENKGPIRFYETSGSGTYYTMSRGSIEEFYDISPSALTFYVQTAQAASILEVIYWEL